MQKRTPSTDRLVKAFLQLKTMDECYNFLEDVCTIKELSDMAQRLDVAVLLSKNLSYQEITAKTGVSAATISRVNRCLNYGSSGYTLVLDTVSEDLK